jgi:hypothetical protein
MTKQTKKLSAQTSTPTVAPGEQFIKVDANGNVTRIPLASLQNAIMGGKPVDGIEDGIFIMYHRKSDNYPLLVKPHKWPSLQTSGEIADGVVVVEGGRLLVVAPTQGENLLWSSANIAGGGVMTSDRVTAYSDMAGKTNTASQLTHAECQGDSNAPGFCAAYSRTNANGYGLTAGKWWLPSLGEMFMIYANMTKINYALSLITGATQLVENWYWTSTEYSATRAWYLYPILGNMGNITKASGRYRVRPVSAFIS